MKFNVVAHRKWWFTLSGLLMIPAIFSVIFFGFNFGIDFTGGTILDLAFQQPVAVSEVREALKDDGLQTSVIQLSGDVKDEKGTNVMIRTRNLSSEESKTVIDHLDAHLGSSDVKRIETVGAVIGSEVTQHTILNVLLSLAALIAYVSYRFEYRIALSAILAICHDIMMVLGVFAFFHLEVDASFLAAVLTVLGYSMNESIVIFDRIRENLRTHRKTDPWEVLANDSIKQSIHRSIYTLTTVLFATGSLYFFGGDTTKNFALVMLIGFISGAYSSICVATSIWVTWHEHAGGRDGRAHSQSHSEKETKAVKA